jgi:hypothetical protein
MYHEFRRCSRVFPHKSKTERDAEASHIDTASTQQKTLSRTLSRRSRRSHSDRGSHTSERHSSSSLRSLTEDPDDVSLSPLNSPASIPRKTISRTPSLREQRNHSERGLHTLERISSQRQAAPRRNKSEGAIGSMVLCIPFAVLCRVLHTRTTGVVYESYVM